MSKEQIMKYSVIGLILLAIIIALTVILWPKAPDTSAGMGLTVDPYSGSFVQPEKAEEDTESTGGIAIPGWGSITLPAGVTEAATTLKNPEANEGWYYLTFEMRLPTVDEETGEESYEVLFTTGLIPPGQYCNQVTLTRALEAGEYNVILHVQPYRMSDKTPTNNADTETLLIVE